jgi:hypothetical protein
MSFSLMAAALVFKSLTFPCFTNIDYILDVEWLIVATESAQTAKENQKTLCFVCDKMIAKDSSKRRLHIGKHILKALRKVSESPVSTNLVSCLTVGTSLGTLLLSNRLVHCLVGHVERQLCWEPVP